MSALPASVQLAEAAHKTMDEVGSAVVAISLVLIGVFLPTAFISGLQGSFYKQFAITIAASTAISAFVSLTLSPAMAALLLRPHNNGDQPRSGLLYILATPLRAFFRRFNQLFTRLSNGYATMTRRLIRISVIMLVAYAGLLALTYQRLAATPTGLLPQIDRGTSSPRSSCRRDRRSTDPTRSSARLPSSCLTSLVFVMRWHSSDSTARPSPMRRTPGSSSSP
jgi:multidrug efflux pump subunit AcrB